MKFIIKPCLRRKFENNSIYKKLEKNLSNLVNFFFKNTFRLYDSSSLVPLISPCLVYSIFMLVNTEECNACQII